MHYFSTSEGKKVTFMPPNKKTKAFVFFFNSISLNVFNKSTIKNIIWEK